MNIHNVEFIKSAASAKDIIIDHLPQIVFSGKSNVGKSSVINMLLNRKRFARTSGSPGKTIHINYFEIDKKAYFVDLPGYGYAKVSKTERDRWSVLMEDYFSDPDHITLGVMIVDSRHKPTGDDITMASWFKGSGCKMVVVANKVDKIRRKSETEGNIALIRSTLELRDETPIIEFSAEKGTGRDKLLGEIRNVL